MAIDVSQFHQIFFEESFEGLDLMEMSLLNLNEDAADMEAVNAIFRAAHSIKGGAGTFGFMAISEFTHDLETLLDEVRGDKRSMTARVINVCLEAVDALRNMLTASQDKVEFDAIQVEQVSAHLKQLLAGDDTAESEVSVESEPEPASDVEAVSHGWTIRFAPHLGMLKTGNDPLRLIKELNTLGELSVTLNTDNLPAFIDMMPDECYLAWDLELKGNVDKALLDEIFDWVEFDCDLLISPLQIEEPQIQVEMPSVDDEPAISDMVDDDQVEAVDATAADSFEIPQADPVQTEEVKSKAVTIADNKMSSIRVDTDKVDSLINLVGELVITQSMLTQLGDEFQAESLPKLLDGLEQLERNTRELQEGIMRIRMLPISFVFNRFPRLVHDLSLKMGKKVELKITGEQTEVDKSVMEKIGDPLVHLVRNSLDHGLETPEQRQQLGKAETGLIQLNAYHQGGNIIIEVIDDGAGMNEEKIFNKAVEKGLIEATEQLTSDKIYELVFMPGFSTVEEVSDVSGRGVGMDVVRKNIQSLGGNIDIQTAAGKGATFTVRLPLTLAIMDGQVIQVAEQKYIIPLVSIIESVEVDAQRIKTVAGKGELYQLREDYIPLIRLHQVFELEQAPKPLDASLLVVVESENSQIGLLIDDLISQQQIVIKSLEANYKNVMGLAGATILGDGMVALILDVMGLRQLHQQLPPKNKNGQNEAA